MNTNTAAAADVRVLVPGAGYRHVSTAHEVPAGGSVAHMNATTLHILDASGSFVKAVTHTPTKIKTSAARAKDGWVAHADWTNTGSDPIGSFSTMWTVPAPPQTHHGQTVFLFNSLVPRNGDAILQPVLQFGTSMAGGGAYWAIASWYVAGETSFFTPLVQVKVGTALTGTMTLTSGSGSLYNYVSSFAGIQGTSLGVSVSKELVWATETLEAYAVTAESDYPAGATVFRGINLALQSGSVPNIAWTTVSDTADGISTKVNIDGARNAEIAINY